jgi:hypothetical protein
MVFHCQEGGVGEAVSSTRLQYLCFSALRVVCFQRSKIRPRNEPRADSGTSPRLFSEMSGASTETSVKVGRNAAFELKSGMFQYRAERGSYCDTYGQIEIGAL